MNDVNMLNDAIKILNEKVQQKNKFIITKPLTPGEDPPPVDINEMGKAFSEYSVALEEFRKIRAALTEK